MSQYNKIKKGDFVEILELHGKYEPHRDSRGWIEGRVVKIESIERSYDNLSKDWVRLKLAESFDTWGGPYWGFMAVRVVKVKKRKHWVESRISGRHSIERYRRV